MTAPKALVVTSDGSSGQAVTPVLAALEVAGLTVRAMDVGRVGSRETGTVDRVMRAITGEFAERRLSKELQDNPPDVAIAFDPGSASALSVARDHLPRPAPVVAVVPELTPGSSWKSTDADRYLTVDDEAAVALSDVGIPGERIIPVGPIGEVEFADVASVSRADARKSSKLPPSGLVVLVEVDGLGYEISSQVALQLSLIERPATYLFAAGGDVQAATALRSTVPTLGMKAKLFGHTVDAPKLWRCANVIVTRPRPESVARALLVGARVVAFSPDDEQGRNLAGALESRGLGRSASNALMISSALEPMLVSSKKVSAAGADGAANIADIAWVVGSERDAVLDQRESAARARTYAGVDSVASAAEAAAKMSAAPGELEDLSGDSFGFGDLSDEPVGPDLHEIQRLRRDLGVRMHRLQRTIADAQKRSRQWQKKHEAAKKSGAKDMAREAERNADLERARMHSSLAEMAQIEQEIKRLDAAEKAAPKTRRPRARPKSSKKRRGSGTSTHATPSVDDLLDQMKRDSSGAAPKSTARKKKKKRKKKRGSGVDDELAALKRKMAAKKGRKS